MAPRTQAELERLQGRYDAIFEAISPPFAFVDLAAMRANAEALSGQAAPLPVRIASKSVRSTAVLDRIMGLDDRFRGILSFTLPEALHLARRGHEDIFVGYPTADRAALSELAVLAAERPDTHPALIVDEPAHLDLIESAAGRGSVPIRVAIDIDPGWWPARGRVARIGPKRSPIRTAERARRFAAEITERPGTKLVGAMAYEGHIAGVGDNLPGKPLRSAAIRTMQSRSLEELKERLPGVIAAVRDAAGSELEWVNAGGTGSLARSKDLGIATELTSGSGFYAPTLFDTYRSLDLTPAAFFCLPVVRRPHPGVATALGGGYIASGAPGKDRLPQPYMPPGLTLDPDEAAGEVQTPLIGAAAKKLRVGDRVYMRHAKAGELCERFDSLYLIEGDAIVDEVPTYRGEGLAFL
ncbi:MAG: alanine racemase [Actinomycetota bacterium]|nr:alanine racemase [Actinomycetota bacterium]